MTSNHDKDTALDSKGLSLDFENGAAWKVDHEILHMKNGTFKHLNGSINEVMNGSMLSGLPYCCCVSGQVLAKHIEGEEKASGLILSHTFAHFRDVLKEAKSDGLALMKCTFAANTVYDSASLEYALAAARSSAKEGTEDCKKLKKGVFEDDTVVGYEKKAGPASTPSSATTTAMHPQTERNYHEEDLKSELSPPSPPVDPRKDAEGKFTLQRRPVTFPSFLSKRRMHIGCTLNC
jgi:hypothetical protein